METVSNLNSEKYHFQSQNYNMQHQETQNLFRQIDINQDFGSNDKNQPIEKLQDLDSLQINNETENINQKFYFQHLSNNDKTSIKASAINDYPRFSDIQKSFEILRKAIPQIFTNETIDNLYEIIIKKTANISRKHHECVFKQDQEDQEHKLQNYQHNQLNGIKNQIKSKIGNSYPGFKNSQMNTGGRANDIITIHRPQLVKSSQLSSKNEKKYIPKYEVEMIEVQKSKKPKKQQMATGEEIFQGINLTQKLQRIWMPYMQDLLINLYQKGHKFSSIKNEFRQKFPEYSSLFTVDTVRCKLYKLIRASIRLLQQNLQNLSKHRLPQLINLSDQMIKSVMYRIEAMPLRLALLQIYVSEHCDISLIRNTIIKANQFFRYHYRIKQQR